MAVPTGTHRLGPDDASLQVRTYREGVAAKAGHDLIIDVTRWDATVEVGDEPAGWSIELNADPRSLEIREGLRGVKPLTDKDRVEIRKNIDEKILGSHPIRFRSSAVRPGDDGGRLAVEGELSMAGSTHPLAARRTLVSITRYVAAHAPTPRAQYQTYHIAERLLRGEDLTVASDE